MSVDRNPSAAFFAYYKFITNNICICISCYTRLTLKMLSIVSITNLNRYTNYCVSNMPYISLIPQLTRFCVLHIVMCCWPLLTSLFTVYKRLCNFVTKTINLNIFRPRVLLLYRLSCTVINNFEFCTDVNTWHCHKIRHSKCIVEVFFNNYKTYQSQSSQSLNV